jgi:cold shock protein
VSSRDRYFRPTRRYSFDDDNFEPPRRSFGSTPGFSAQRFETPPGPPVQAVVKWYNPDEGFGFVQPADGSPQVTEILSVDSSTAQQEPPYRRARRSRSATQGGKQQPDGREPDRPQGNPGTEVEAMLGRLELDFFEAWTTPSYQFANS